MTSDTPAWGAFGRALDVLLRAMAYLAGVIVVAMVVAVSYEVVMRYAFNRPTRWVIELCEYALVYIGFLSCAWVLREEGHVKVDFMLEMLSPAARRFFHVLTSYIGALVCATVAWTGAVYVYGLFVSGEELFRSLQVPKWTILVVVPIGMALLALQFLRRATTREVIGQGAGF